MYNRWARKHQKSFHKMWQEVIQKSLITWLVHFTNVHILSQSNTVNESYFSLNEFFSKAAQFSQRVKKWAGTRLDLHVGEMYISHTKVKPRALSRKRQKKNKKRMRKLSFIIISWSLWLADYCQSNNGNAWMGQSGEKGHTYIPLTQISQF